MLLGILMLVFYVLTYACLQDEKRKYDKVSQSYYSALEKHLGTSNKKKEPALIEVQAKPIVGMGTHTGGFR